MKDDNQAKRRRQRMWLRVTAAALLLSLAALIAGTVSFTHYASRANTESARQADSNRHIRQMQAILVALGDAERGQRGYLLTDKPSYLAPYRAAVANLPQLLSSLDGIPVEHAKMAAHTATVRELVGRKLAELAETIRLHDAGRQDAALALMQTDAGQDYMERARAELGAAMDTLRADRDVAGNELVANTAAIRRLAIAAVAVLVLCVLLAGVQVRTLGIAQARYARALAESEQQHRAMVEEQHELISLATEDGTLTYLNPAYSRHFRQATSEMTGKNLFDLVEPADRAAVEAQIRSVFRSGEPVESENRVRTPDGDERWIAWTNSIQRGPGGERLLHSVGRDITKRKQAEQALRASEAFLARTGRVAGVGGWELELATHALHWSNEVKRIHEVGADYVPTFEAAIAFYAPEVREAIREAIRASGANGTPLDLELPLVTAAGRRVWVHTVGEIERDAGGRPLRMVGALQDITERKALQEQLAASERFVREITDNLPVRIAYVDREGRFKFVNSAHCQRFGRRREEILGRKRSELFGRPVEADVAAHLEAAYHGTPQRFEYEEIVDGETRLIQSQVIPDFDASGRVRGLYTTGVDITTLKANERKLRDLNEILEKSPDYIVQTDWQGRVQYLNPAARRALGFTADAAVDGHSFSEFNTAETNERYAREITPAVKREGAWLGETTVLAAGAKVTPVNHLVIAHRDATGRVAKYSAVMRDVSQVVAGRRALQLQTATLGAVIEAIPAMVAVFDSRFRYRLVNRAFERWRGKTRDEVVGRGVAELFGQVEFDRSWPWAQRALAGETVSYEKDYPEADEHRHVSLAYVPLRLDDGTIDGVIGVAQDITIHRDEERRLLDLSERDALTGVLNRAGFNSVLARQCESGGAATLGMLYIDLDRFKPVNDTHGHRVGDELLQQFARRLQNLVRPTDAVARLGGDEFAVLLTGVRELANAQAVADKVVDAARMPFAIGALTLTIGASVGVAYNAADADGGRGLIERADAMVYQAKAAGRGRRA